MDSRCWCVCKHTSINNSSTILLSTLNHVFLSEFLGSKSLEFGRCRIKFEDIYLIRRKVQSSNKPEV